MIRDEQKVFTDKQLLSMMLPLFAERVLQMVVGMADTLMVSYAGEAVVSGVSLDNMIYQIFGFVSTAVSAGGSAVISQYIGGKRKRDGDLAAAQLFFISLVYSTLFLLGGMLFGNRLLGILYGSVEPDVMAACRTYLGIVILSFPANAVYNAGAAMYRSMGKTKTTLSVSACMNFVNLAGNFVGIFLLHAGAAGVAWPTVISWYFAAFVMVLLCMRKGEPVTLSLMDATYPDKRMDERILRIALPNGIENGLFQASKVLIGSFVATFGTAQIAANGIGQTIWSMAVCFSSGITAVFITVTGQCMGAGDSDAGEYYLRKLTRMAILFGSIWCCIVTCITPAILMLYQVTPETKHYVIVIVLIHNIAAAILQPVVSPLAAGLRAAGDATFTMFAALFCTLVVRIAASLVLAFGMNLGVVGITIAMVLDWLVKTFLILGRFYSGKWKTFRVI